MVAAPEVAGVLITYKCTLLLTLSQDGSTALQAACKEGHYQVAELLLQAGGSVELETKVR